MSKTMRKAAVILLMSSYFPLISEDNFEPLKPFNWQEMLEAPSIDRNGNQVLHFGGRNKPYKNNPKAVEFVEKNLKNAKRLDSDADVLRFGSDSITLTDGFIIEAGVGSGRTINHIAALNPKRKVYGFDSFEGLPYEWKRPDKSFKVGIFKMRKNRCFSSIPTINNVFLYKGLFKDTLPIFKEKVMKNKPIAFLHIDSDIYESAKDIFDTLEDNIVPGTVIVLDEFYNYPNCENHEWKALQEFLHRKGLIADYIAFNINHEQVALIIRSKKYLKK